MWTLITGYEPDRPMVPKPYATTVLDRIFSGWTYGHALLEQSKAWDPNNETEGTLLSLVAQCMDYMPSRRPKLSNLETICEGFMERDWEAPHDIMRAWAGGLFADAPPPQEAV